MNSVAKAHTRTNDVAGHVAQIHGDSGTMALLLLRVKRANRDANIQAMRDIVADEIKHQRHIDGGTIQC